MLNSRNKVISGIYVIQDILELQNMKKIMTVIDASFSLYLTIHMVILQFLQHLVNLPDNFSFGCGCLGERPMPFIMEVLIFSMYMLLE